MLSTGTLPADGPADVVVGVARVGLSRSNYTNVHRLCWCAIKGRSSPV